MTDGVQPGTEVDPAVWEAFRKEVKRRRGGVRGHIRTELENALRDYIHGGDATPNEINERLQRIEAAVGAAGTDGGADTFEPAEHTHTPGEKIPDKKPAANAATDKKLRYLTGCVHEEVGKDFLEIPESLLRDVVKSEYGFRSDTAKRYVEQLTDELGLVDHPRADPLVCTPNRREELLNEHADEELDTL